MPRLHSGDPGDGDGGDDSDDEDALFVPPLPPEDRLWRHPSEVGRQRAQAGATTATAGVPVRRVAQLVLATGLVGVGLAIGAVALLDGPDRPVEQQVAVRPATVVEGAPDGGHTGHGWLGLHGRDLEADDAAALDVVGGAVVDDVIADGPADRAGLQPGDVIVSVDDQATRSMAALIAALQRREPGDEVELGIRRDHRPRTVRATLVAKSPG